MTISINVKYMANKSSAHFALCSDIINLFKVSLEPRKSSKNTLTPRMAVSPTSAGGPRAVLLNVAENTTLHGVPNAYRSSSWVRKTIWSTLFLASFGELEPIAVCSPVLHTTLACSFNWKLFELKIGGSVSHQ